MPARSCRALTVSPTWLPNTRLPWRVLADVRCCRIPVVTKSSALMPLLQAIASRDERTVARLLDASPNLASQVADLGATRQASRAYFLDAITHYVYAGDTALHIAAAAYDRDIAK